MLEAEVRVRYVDNQCISLFWKREESRVPEGE